MLNEKDLEHILTRRGFLAAMFVAGSAIILNGCQSKETEKSQKDNITHENDIPNISKTTEGIENLEKFIQVALENQKTFKRVSEEISDVNKRFLASQIQTSRMDESSLSSASILEANIKIYNDLRFSFDADKEETLEQLRALIYLGFLELNVFSKNIGYDMVSDYAIDVIKIAVSKASNYEISFNDITIGKKSNSGYENDAPLIHYTIGEESYRATAIGDIRNLIEKIYFCQKQAELVRREEDGDDLEYNQDRLESLSTVIVMSKTIFQEDYEISENFFNGTMIGNTSFIK